MSILQDVWYELDNLLEDANTLIVDIMVDELNKIGLFNCWENYSGKLSKNVKNRGWPNVENSDFAYQLIEDSFNALEEECKNIFGLNLYAEGRMGGHWCLSSNNNQQVLEALFDVKLTPTGKKFAALDSYDNEAFLEKMTDLSDEDIIKKMIIISPKKSFIEFEKNWEAAIQDLESCTDADFDDENQEIEIDDISHINE